MASAPLRSDAVRNVERVIEAACSVLGKNPAASMEQVAVASEVHRSTLYRRFPTRDDLVQAILERALAEVTELVQTANAGPPAQDKLQLLCTQLVALSGRYGFLLAHVRLADLGPDPIGLTKLLRRYQRAGILRSDMPADWLASVFMAIGTALLQHDETAGPAGPDAPQRFLTTFLDGTKA
jgi:AcrR family transcriptional regulator